MTAPPDVLDSNILIYSYDPREQRKQVIAQNRLLRAVKGESLASTSVLAEVASTFLHKMSLPARLGRVNAVVDTLSPIQLVLADEGIVRRALEAREAYGVHFYDGMIIAAAERGGCGRIWSEDMNAGQKYFGIAVQNPF